MQSQESKDKQTQLGKNLGKLYEGINGTGHRDIPRPLDEVIPAKDNWQPLNKDHFKK